MEQDRVRDRLHELRLGLVEEERKQKSDFQNMLQGAEERIVAEEKITKAREGSTIRDSSLLKAQATYESLDMKALLSLSVVELTRDKASNLHPNENKENLITDNPTQKVKTLDDQKNLAHVKVPRGGALSHHLKHTCCHLEREFQH